MPKIIKGDQQSDEWFRLRLGSIGGSSIKAVMTKGKYKTRQSLMYQLASELITGRKFEVKQTQAMKDGIDREDDARKRFEQITDIPVKQIALIKGDIKHTHYSPDGLWSKRGLLELKSPQANTQAKYLDENRLPPEYKYQVHYGLGISKYKRCYFFSYHPGMKYLLLEIEPDKILIKETMKEACLFIHDMKKLVKKIS